MLPGGIVKRGGVPPCEGGVVDDPAKRLLQVMRCCAGERLEFVIAARELSVGRTQRRRVPHGDVVQGPVGLFSDASLLARPRQALPAHRLLPHRGGTARGQPLPPAARYYRTLWIGGPTHGGRYLPPDT